MKLALYLPNFRDKVTLQELEDLTALAEELDFDSVWTLDRIVVPEASDRAALHYPFGMMTDFPPIMPVIARGEWFQGFPLLPWLAAKTTRLRIGMSIIDTPYRSPGVLATIDHLSGGRLSVGVGSGWMPEEFAAATATHLVRRHRRGDRPDAERQGQQPAGRHRRADHRHAEALPRRRAGHAPALAAVPRRADGQDARRPQASHRGDHARGRGRATGNGRRSPR